MVLDDSRWFCGGSGLVAVGCRSGVGRVFGPQRAGAAVDGWRTHPVPLKNLQEPLQNHPELLRTIWAKLPKTTSGPPQNPFSSVVTINLVSSSLAPE